MIIENKYTYVKLLVLICEELPEVGFLLFDVGALKGTALSDEMTKLAIFITESKVRRTFTRCLPTPATSLNHKIYKMEK